MDDRVVSYAQNREDILLAAFFPENKKGFYVDVGASHPVVSSVTKLFYERGWRGINIEPNRKHYNLLVEDRPRDINIEVGVADKEGELNFREYEGYGLSTFSEGMKENYTKNRTALTQNYKDYVVPVTTLKSIFEKYKVKNIDFLKIDIEGFEYEALMGNDWKKYRPEVICIESNHMTKDWRPLLEKHAYEKVFYDGLNDYYLAKEKKELLENFSYENALLLGKPIIPLRWHQEIAQHQAQIRKLELELQSARNRQREQDVKIAHLNVELAEQRRIRNLAKTLLRSLDNALRLKIENLNQPKRKHASKLVPLSKQAISKNAKSRKTLLAIAHKNDLESFYTKHKTGGYTKSYVYKIVFFVYRAIRKILKTIYRGLIKIYRMIKRGNK